MSCVLQPWVCDLTLMQQSVLLTALRAPDGLIKSHPTKTLSRWLRRCILISAFDKRVLEDPYEPGGGSFTGPCKTDTIRDIDHVIQLYIDCGDEIPLHFFFHFMQATEILGYKHPKEPIRKWWLQVYFRLVGFGHLNPESEEQLDLRLSDNEKNWRAREV